MVIAARDEAHCRDLATAMLENRPGLKIIDVYPLDFIEAPKELEETIKDLDEKKTLN